MPGYILVDCTGLDLTKGSTPQSISGIYAKVKAAYNTTKPIYAINATWGTLAVTPIQCFAIDWTDYFIVTASTLQIIVNKNDAVTIVNMAPAS